MNTPRRRTPLAPRCSNSPPPTSQRFKDLSAQVSTPGVRRKLVFSEGEVVPSPAVKPAPAPADKESIRVCVRKRPLASTDADVFRIDASTIYCDDHVFTFPCVIGPATTNRAVYESVADDVVRHIHQGWSGTIFAYGQTNSGKTHTMLGTRDDEGVVPRSLRHIFTDIHGSSEATYAVGVRMIEIYNEKMSDLLTGKEIGVFDTKDRGTVLTGCDPKVVSSPDEALGVLSGGLEKRHVAGTQANAHSSRSHLVIQLRVNRCPKDAAQSSTSSVLNLVDLAGSESLKKTGATGATAREGKHINKSLNALVRVIAILAGDAKASGGHIPFRDSKLTRILQPSLGGDTRAAVICCVTGAARETENTLSTLRFARSAAKVKNRPKVTATEEGLTPAMRKAVEKLAAAQTMEERAALREEVTRLMQSTEELRRCGEEAEEARGQLVDQVECEKRKAEHLEALLVPDSRVKRRRRHGRFSLPPPGQLEARAGAEAEEATARADALREFMELRASAPGRPSCASRPSVTTTRTGSDPGAGQDEQRGPDPDALLVRIRVAKTSLEDIQQQRQSVGEERTALRERIEEAGAHAVKLAEMGLEQLRANHEADAAADRALSRSSEVLQAEGRQRMLYFKEANQRRVRLRDLEDDVEMLAPAVKRLRVDWEECAVLRQQQRQLEGTLRAAHLRTALHSLWGRRWSDEEAEAESRRLERRLQAEYDAATDPVHAALASADLEEGAITGRIDAMEDELGEVQERHRAAVERLSRSRAAGEEQAAAEKHSLRDEHARAASELRRQSSAAETAALLSRAHSPIERELSDVHRAAAAEAKAQSVRLALEGATAKASAGGAARLRETELSQLRAAAAAARSRGAEEEAAARAALEKVSAEAAALAERVRVEVCERACIVSEAWRLRQQLVRSSFACVAKAVEGAAEAMQASVEAEVTTGAWELEGVLQGSLESARQRHSNQLGRVRAANEADAAACSEVRAELRRTAAADAEQNRSRLRQEAEQAEERLRRWSSGVAELEQAAATSTAQQEQFDAEAGRVAAAAADAVEQAEAEKDAAVESAASESAAERLRRSGEEAALGDAHSEAVRAMHLRHEQELASEKSRLALEETAAEEKVGEAISNCEEAAEEEREALRSKIQALRTKAAQDVGAAKAAADSDAQLRRKEVAAIETQRGELAAEQKAELSEVAEAGERKVAAFRKGKEERMERLRQTLREMEEEGAAAAARVSAAVDQMRKDAAAHVETAAAAFKAAEEGKRSSDRSAVRALEATREGVLAEQRAAAAQKDEVQAHHSKAEQELKAETERLADLEREIVAEEEKGLQKGLAEAEKKRDDDKSLTIQEIMSAEGFAAEYAEAKSRQEALSKVIDKYTMHDAKRTREHRILRDSNSVLQKNVERVEKDNQRKAAALGL